LDISPRPIGHNTQDQQGLKKKNYQASSKCPDLPFIIDSKKIVPSRKYFDLIFSKLFRFSPGRADLNIYTMRLGNDE
jgi:hypothetical protein